MNKSKKQMLDKEGYIEMFDESNSNSSRGIFYNKRTKKIFSEEAIDDHSEEWLHEGINEPSSCDWQFYFNREVSDKIKQEILKGLGEI